MMKLDVTVQAFDMQDISNRRFLYNPKTGILVLGQQYGKTRGLPGSHADDLALSLIHISEPTRPY